MLFVFLCGLCSIVSVHMHCMKQQCSLHFTARISYYMNKVHFLSLMMNVSAVPLSWLLWRVIQWLWGNQTSTRSQFSYFGLMPVTGIAEAPDTFIFYWRISCFLWWLPSYQHCTWALISSYHCHHLFYFWWVLLVKMNWWYLTAILVSISLMIKSIIIHTFMSVDHVECRF